MLDQNTQTKTEGEQIENNFPVINPTTPNINQSQPIEMQSQTTEFPEPKRGNRRIIAILSIIFLLLIIGGGVFAYFKYFKSPEMIIQKALFNYSKITSLEYTGKIDIKIDKGELSGMEEIFSDEREVGALISFSGKSEINDINNLKGQFSFNIETNALTKDKFAFGLEAILLENFFYLKFSELPELVIIDLSKLKNQWIKFDTKTLDDEFGGGNLEKKTEKDQDLTPEKIEKLQIAFQQSKVIEITDKLPNEKIEGMNTYHYGFRFNKEGLQDFLIKGNQIIQDKPLDEEEISELKEDVEKVEMSEGEIWIGKKDLLIYRFTLASKINKENDYDFSGSTDLSISFKNFNQPVQIEAPQQTKTPEEIAQEIAEDFQKKSIRNIIENWGQEGMELQDTDNDGLDDELEAIFGTDPNKADTDGDGFNDKEELLDGYNPNGAGTLKDLDSNPF